jgi:hypothetical protein
MTAPIDLSLPESVPDDRYRRRIGLILGALLGFTYGLVSLVGNRLMLPGIPLYQPPLGAFGDTLMFTAIGAVLGFLVAWPRSGVKGVFLMAAAAALGFVLLSIATGQNQGQTLAFQVVAAISLSLPIWGLFVPIFAALRWVIGQEEEAHRDGRAWRGRVLAPLVLVLIVGLVAYSAVYPPRGRDALKAAQAMLSEAAATRTTPEALAQVPGFAENNGAPYQLSWEGSDIARFRIPRPSRNFDLHSAVIARYPSGWNLVCVYITAEEPPVCRGFDALP